MGEKDMHESELNAAQPARHPRKKKRGRAGKVIRKTVKIVVVLVLAVGAGLFGLKAYIGKQAEENQGESYSRAAVTRGAMEETVYGTGTTAARNQTHVLAGADGTLTDLRVSVGDEVKAGDILAVLTNADLDDEITDLEFDLWELDDTILDTGTGSKATAVEAPAAGRVMAVYAGVGDDALAVFRREGALAVISTDGRMKVELSGVDAGAGVALNDKLVVTGENFTAEGTVVDLTRQGTSPFRMTACRWAKPSPSRRRTAWRSARARWRSTSRWPFPPTAARLKACAPRWARPSSAATRSSS